MSVYLNQRQKTYRYDFTYQAQRHTQAGFRTKREALAAEAARKEELNNPEAAQPRGRPTPSPIQPPQTTQTDMDFLELVNRRLDFVKAYRSEKHYRENVYLAKRWVKRWQGNKVSEITREEIERFILTRKKVSPHAGNKELKYLRALFNFAIKREWLERDPTRGLEFFPVEKRLKRIPSNADIDKVIGVADPSTRDYLWTIRDTMARVGEIDRLEWRDVNLEAREIVLYTRKKRGGSLTPRKIPMSDNLYEIMLRRYQNREKSKPWVFWHEYRGQKTGKATAGPFKQRKRLMRGLCKLAGVEHFGFHALRHAGASLMESINVPISSIQRILGHENRTTTEIYLHSIGSAERSAIQAFERAR